MPWGIRVWTEFDQNRSFQLTAALHRASGTWPWTERDTGNWWTVAAHAFKLSSLRGVAVHPCLLSLPLADGGSENRPHNFTFSLRAKCFSFCYFPWPDVQINSARRSFMSMPSRGSAMGSRLLPWKLMLCDFRNVAPFLFFFEGWGWVGGGRSILYQ